MSEQRKLHMRVITGAHKPPAGSEAIVRTTLTDELAAIPEDDALLLILGGAEGVDDMAKRWTQTPLVLKRGGVFVRELPALWRLFEFLGAVHVAGPVRNEEMAQCAEVYVRMVREKMGPDAVASVKCLAFPGLKSRGTWDCAGRCNQRMPVDKVKLEARNG